MTVVKMPRKGGGKPPEIPAMPEAEKRTLVEHLLYGPARDRIVSDMVDRIRSHTFEQDKLDYWKARLAFIEETARRERSVEADLREGLRLLFRDVKAENKRRQQIAIAPARLPFDEMEFDPAKPAQIFRFPGTPDVDEDEVYLPKGFK